MTDLSAFLAAAAARPLEWGRCDCSLMVADWLHLARGVHPAPDLVGRYDDEAGARREVEQAGGLVALFRPRLGALGLVQTDTPRPGDVAVVTLHGHEFGGIRAASGWAVKTARGLRIARAFEPLVCWTV